MSDNDLGLIADPASKTSVQDDDLGLIKDTPVSSKPIKDDDLGLVADQISTSLKKDYDDLGLQPEAGGGDIFQGDKEQWYSGAARKVSDVASAFMSHFNKASPLGIGERIANPSKDLLTNKDKLDSKENPAAAMLGEASGGAATFMGAALIPQVSLPIAFGAAGALSGVADQADTIKDANDQLSLGQRIGKVGVDAVAGGITGKIFSTAARGATILDRVIERSGGAGATAFNQSLADQVIEGKEPNVHQAIAQGGLQAVSIGIVGAMAEVPHLRGLIMDEAKSKIGPDGTVMGSNGFYKVDPDNLNIEQAKKILDDHLINPESLSPEFQQAQYDIRKEVALENVDVKAKQYGVDPKVIKEVINAQDQRTRESILTQHLTDMVRTDPEKARKLLPFFDAIKQGADPTDIIIMSDILHKFGTKTTVEESVGTPDAKAGETNTDEGKATVGATEAATTPNKGLTEEDHKDIGNLLDWESSQEGGQRWSFINAEGKREMGGAPSGHSEAMQDIGPKESLNLLRKAQAGGNLTDKQKDKVNQLLTDYRANIKASLEEVTNARTELTEPEAAEVLRRDQEETGGTQASWDDEEQQAADHLKQSPEVNPDTPKYKLASPIFYSHLEKTVNDKMPNAASAEQIKGILSNAGVKQEEMDWLGIDDFLKENPKPTKAQLLDYIKAHNVEVQEVEKGGHNLKRYGLKLTPNGWVIEDQVSGQELNATGETEGNSFLYDSKLQAENALDKFKENNPENGTKFSAYQLPGGNNYRELLLTLPSQVEPFEGKALNRNEFEEFTDLGNTLNRTPTEEERYQALKKIKTDYDSYHDNYTKNLGKDFNSNHFEEPNILAHIRFNDRTDADGKKVLFIEEAQSDWHQKGRKLGYRGTTDLSPQKMSDRIIQIESKGTSATSEEKQEWAYLKSILENKGVPDAPFKKSWHELAMKRMLRYAAENGYDKIAWTTGEQQADRYDLSKQIDSIDFEKDRLNKEVTISVNKDGKRVDVKKFPINNPSAIEEYVGKDIAKKIGESEELNGTLKGVDLKVGGEGMKGFYDQILPSFMNKYTKKWGGRVQQTKLPYGDPYPGSHYEGPEYTLEQLERALEAANLGGPDKYKSPLTGKYQHFAVNRVAISMPLKNIIKDIKSGKSFKEAVNETFSYDIAELFGGKYVAEKPKMLEHKAHSVDITPSMKESVLNEGQPLFKRQPTWDELKQDNERVKELDKQGRELIKKYIPELLDTFENVPFLYSQEGVRAVGKYVNGNIQVVHGQGAEVYVHEIGHAIFDMFLTPQEKKSLLHEAAMAYQIEVPEQEGETAQEYQKRLDHELEEKIMDDFERYYKDELRRFKDSWSNKLIGFFQKVAESVTKFFGIKKSGIDRFYRDILNENFRNFVPQNRYDTTAKYKKSSKLSNESGKINLPIDHIAGMAKELVNTIIPTVGVPRKAMDTIMAMKGGQDKLEAKLEFQLNAIRKMFERMEQKDQIAFIDNIKLGRPQATPQLQAIATMMRDVEDKLWAQAKQYKPSLAYLDNHFRVLWKVIPAGSDQKVAEIEAEINTLKSQPIDPKITKEIKRLQEIVDLMKQGVNTHTKGGFKGLFRKPLQGSKGWAKQHTLNDMSEGIKYGGVPYSYNPLVMWQNAQMDLMKFITAQHMFENLKKIGFLKYVRQGDTVPQGFVRLNDSIARVYFPAQVQFSSTAEPHTVPVQIGEYYIEENTGRIMNNFLSPDYIRQSKIGHSLLTLKNMTTALELSVSPFHAMFTSGSAMSQGVGLGLQQILNVGVLQANPRAVLQGLANIGKGLTGFSTYELSHVGTQAIKYMSGDQFKNDPDVAAFLKAFPDAEDLLNDLFIGGGKLAIHQDYKLNAIRGWREAVKNKDVLALTITSLPAANELLMKPLFEVYIPRLKIGAFLKEYSTELVARQAQLKSGSLTRAQLAAQVWNSVENRFGEMNFDNIFWDRTFKSGLQLAIRSVTWKLGQAKNIGGATPKQIIEIVNAIKEGRPPLLHRDFAWLLGLCTLVAALSTILMESTIQEQPKDLIDVIAPRYDKTGNRIFWNTHIKDWLHATHNFGTYIGSSLAGIWGRLWDVWRNKDYFNNEIASKSDPKWQQFLDQTKHLIGEPFSVSNLQQLNKGQAPAGIKAITALGMATPAPKYLTNTPVMNLAKEIQQNKPFSQMTRTKEQQQKFKMLNDLRDGYQQSGDSKALNDAEKKGLITFEKKMEIKKEAKEDPLLRTIKNFSFDEIGSLLNKAIETKSVNEQNKMWPVFREKYFTAQERASVDQIKQNKEIYNDLKIKLGK